MSVANAIVTAAAYAALADAAAERSRDLSPSEAYIAHLMAEGYCRKEIASILCIAVKTVEVHRGRILLKMGAENSIRAAVLFDRYIRDAKLTRMVNFLPPEIAAAVAARSTGNAPPSTAQGD